MSLLSKVLLFISCILTFTTLLFFFQFVAERAYNQDLIAQKEAFSLEAQKRAKLAETQSVRTKDAERMAQQVRNDAIDNLSIASEVKANLERKVAESLVAQKETLARLNTRLEREIIAKQRIEKEAEKYLTQKSMLEHDLLMVWAEMENLKAEHNKKAAELGKEHQKKIKELGDEIERLKKELGDAKQKTEQEIKARLQKETSAKKKAETVAEKYLRQNESLQHSLLMTWAGEENLKWDTSRAKAEGEQKIKSLQSEIESLKKELAAAKTAGASPAKN